MPIPYTTAASQFLYGRSVVLAALRSQRRQIYKLYIIPEDDRGKTDSDDYMIMQLAKWGGIEIVRADRELLNKMSKGRPHNGYVLDASPLPQPEINSLPVVDLEKGSFRTFLDEITPKPRGSSPSMQTQLNSTKKSSRFPFILWLNEIVDPENFGSIIRSAAFFGVDALITSNSSSEGFGISPSLIRLANHEVGIPGGLGRPKSLDSLNVGVAAGVLCQAFLNGGGGGDGMRLEGGGVESQQQQQQREIDTDQNQDEELRLEQEEHQVQEVDQEQESAPEEIKEDEAEKEKEKDENDEKLF
ncbi:MAG: 37S ribosomal protein S24, mitochondrial [Watsoniomyces obsoletus]|nr:MAG: 37S ribosomal protein S24, mitochondrial [Watsoniomyces obsoletus]